MKTNIRVSAPAVFTHEGARAVFMPPEAQLRRTVAACLLWEDGFYEDGATVAERIRTLVPLCRPEFVAACAFEARTRMQLRHVPLLLARELARHPDKPQFVWSLLRDVIQRADELAEFVSLYWQDGARPNGKNAPLSKQVKKGLAAAFGKFDEYALGKYNRDGAVKLRDVLFLCHAKPKDDAQADLWKRLVEGKLAVPDTWETQLSAGADKKVVFERLMAEGKLGALAFLRNLRGMEEAGVDPSMIGMYATVVDVSRVLPFRFLAAARAVPQKEQMLEAMMFAACEKRPKLPGKTLILIDISPSMRTKLSAKADLTRMDAGFGLAMLMREVCEDVLVMSFSTEAVAVPPRRGFALADAILRSQRPSGTMLGRALTQANAVPHDRIIVLTDEESQDAVGAPAAKLAYMINLAQSKNGVGHGKWSRISGWSETVIDYIQELESLQQKEAA